MAKLTIKQELFSSRLSPFLKWPGGKTSELDRISRALPSGKTERFLDPFVGGGSVFLAVNSQIPAEVNDICPELINLYIGAASKNRELEFHLNQIAGTWSELSEVEDDLILITRELMKSRVEIGTLVAHVIKSSSKLMRAYGDDFTSGYVQRLKSDLPKKIARIAKLEQLHQRALPEDEFLANVIGGVRSTFYMQIRTRYNIARTGNQSSSTRDADFFFLREYAYASMFRFNSKGEFNIPYGGISYNKKDFGSKVRYLFSSDLESRLRKSKFHNLDFEAFFDATQPSKEDFIFIDPPYDSDFSDYDGRSFDSTDQHRLAQALRMLDAKIMIVIGDTPLIRKVYKDTDWNIQSEAINYKWTIKSRNDRGANHLAITNY
jgi:DNA adenine methylase